MKYKTKIQIIFIVFTLNFGFSLNLVTTPILPKFFLNKKFSVFWDHLQYFQ